MSTAVVGYDTAHDLSQEFHPDPEINVIKKTEGETDIFNDLEELKNPYPIKNVFCVYLSTNNNWSTAIPVSFTATNHVHTHIKEIMVDQIILRKRWEVEGIKPPNIFCKNKTKEICISLYDKYDIIPRKVDASIEEGIYVLYLNPRNNKTLEIEIYNDLDVAAIVTDNNINKIISSQDIEQNSFDYIIRHFNE